MARDGDGRLSLTNAISRERCVPRAAQPLVQRSLYPTNMTAVSSIRISLDESAIVAWLNGTLAVALACLSFPADSSRSLLERRAAERGCAMKSSDV